MDVPTRVRKICASACAGHMRRQVSSGSELESGLLFMEEGCKLGKEKSLESTGCMQHKAAS